MMELDEVRPGLVVSVPSLNPGERLTARLSGERVQVQSGRREILVECWVVHASVPLWLPPDRIDIIAS